MNQERFSSTDGYFRSPPMNAKTYVILNFEGSEYNIKPFHLVFEIIKKQVLP